MSALDLRSDVLTPPTEAMWAAMRAADVGWALFGEDDNVARLEAIGASLLGKPASLFVPTCGMANLVAMMSLGERGTRVVFERRSHIATSEAAGFAYVCGLLAHPLDAPDGVLDEATVEAAMSEADPAGASLLVLENTHTRAGGVPMTVTRTAGLAAIAHRHGARVHLDGARLLNAAAALDVEAQELTEPVDSVAFSLNKGPGAPLGALLAGSAAVIERARLNLRRLGGASIHQAGLFAAAGIVALESGPRTAREDNLAAAELAQLLGGVPGLVVDTLPVRTNIVTVDVSPLGLEAAAFVTLLEACDIRAFPRGLSHVRFVTHPGIRHAQVLRVVDAITHICAR
jgi:threonine aldolase